MHLPKSAQAPKGLLPKGSQLRGELSVPQGLRIEGELWGNVRATDGDAATVLVAEGATVVGAIEAAHVIVQGQVQGPIVATQQLQLHASAQVDGEMHYRSLTLHPNAQLRGVLVPMLGMVVEAPAVSNVNEPAEQAASQQESKDLPSQANGPTDDAGKVQPLSPSAREDVPSQANP
jgi:cytoskeletal protein CcmA (bactofilin family)